MDSSIPPSPGIYRITCTSNGKIYIGSAINLRRRYNEHFRKLQHGKHSNPKMQRAFNKYKAQAFIFDILELVLIPEMLTVREQFWFGKLKPFRDKGFNISPTAGSNLGLEYTPEHREKIRLALMGHPSSTRGIPRTPETIEKVRTAKRAQFAHISKERTCESCGKTFSVKKHREQRFCSRRCSAQRVANQVSRTCVICGKEFHRQPTKISDYCSAECSYQAHAKLTEEDVRAIRAAPLGYGKTKALAEQYGVTTDAIRRIRQRKVWKHV